MKAIKLSALLAILALMLASAPLALAENCNYLTVKLMKSAIKAGWSIDTNWLKAGKPCEHGTIDSYTNKQVVMRNTGLYGPKCTIKFNGPGSKDSTDIFNQNYCSSSAGDIKVFYEDGKMPCYMAIKGSHGGGKGGVVKICTFH